MKKDFCYTTPVLRIGGHLVYFQIAKTKVKQIEKYLLTEKSPSVYYKVMMRTGE